MLTTLHAKPVDGLKLARARDENRQIPSLLSTASSKAVSCTGNRNSPSPQRCNRHAALRSVPRGGQGANRPSRPSEVARVIISLRKFKVLREARTRWGRLPGRTNQRRSLNRMLLSTRSPHQIRVTFFATADVGTERRTMHFDNDHSNAIVQRIVQLWMKINNDIGHGDGTVPPVCRVAEMWVY